MRAKYTQLAIVVFVIAIGIALRLYQVDYNFDGDEVSSVELATAPLGESLGAWPHLGHPPLHVIMLHGWLSAFGVSEMAARSLSVLCSVIFLVFAFLLLKRLVPPWLAISTLALLAISPFFVYYGQQARPFSLIAALTVMAIYWFVLYSEHQEKRGFLALWFVTSVLLIYTQYFSLFLVGMVCIAALVNLRTSALKMVAAGLVCVLLLVPWILNVFLDVSVDRSGAVSTVSWIQKPTLLSFVWFYVSILGEPEWLKARFLIFAYGAIFLAYALRARQFFASSTIVIAGMAFLLPATGFALSHLTATSFWAPRHLIGAGACFVIFLAVALDCLPHVFGKFMAAFLVLWSALSVPQGTAAFVKPPWEQIASDLSQSGPGVQIVAEESWVALPMRFYLQGRSVELVRTLNPESQGDYLVFVCRPMKCEAIREISRGLRADVLREYTWGNEDPVSETIITYRVNPDPES